MVPRELICLQSSWLSVSGAHFGECLCAYCVRSSRGHYSCLMAHFPTSASCSPVPLRCILIPVTLSFFFSNRLSPYAGSSPPSMSPLVSCSPFHLLLPLSAPLLTIISYPSVILSAVFYNLASLLSVHHVGNNDDNGDDDELRCLLSVCHRHI